MTKKRKNGNGNSNHQNNGDKEHKLLRELKPKTMNQSEYIRAIAENEVIFCTGPAGSGKTAVAVGLACQYLVFGKVKKIVITRPVVEAGKGIGFLPGDANQKLHPYLLPILDEMSTYFDPTELHRLMEYNLIEIAPLEYMRGRNFHRSFMILDEAQNATYDQLKMFVTRMGSDTKCLVNGDLKQSDLVKDGVVPLNKFVGQLHDIEGVAINELTVADIIRNPIISKILEKLD